MHSVIFIYKMNIYICVSLFSAIGKSRAVISHDKLSQMKQGDKPDGATVQREDNQRGEISL